MLELENLGFWCDPVARGGPENMAVDSWLLTQEIPVLRLYHWKGLWGSMGYFGEVEKAGKLLPEVSLVRRETGGGLVDHRNDITYTLVVPRTYGLAKVKGVESYRLIHSALATALENSGHGVELVRHDYDVDSSSCFEKPVEWDLINGQGEKIAGAGQRRTRKGLLHQGSILLRKSADGSLILKRLAHELARNVSPVDLKPSGQSFTELVRQFAADSWQKRR